MQAREDEWHATDALKGIIKNKFCVVFGTKLVEDCFHEGRSLERMGSNRNGRVRPARLWHRLLVKQVHSKRHNYQDLPWRRGSFKRGVIAKNLKACFKPRLRSMSPTMRQIRSHSTSTSWFSPAPLFACIQDLDLCLMKHCKAEAAWQQVKHNWLSCLVRGLQLVIRRRAVGGRWFFCLGEYGNAAIIAWPVRRACASNQEFFVLDSQACYSDLLVGFLYDPGMWEAMLVKCCSPLAAHCKGVPLAEVGCAFLAPASPPVPLMKACAMGCFGNLPKTCLANIAKHFQVRLAANSGIVEMLSSLVMYFLPGLSDDELVKVLELRLNLEADEIGDFLASAEASELMHEDDQQELKQVRKESNFAAQDAKTYTSELKVKRSQVLAKAKAPPLKKPRAGAAKGDNRDRVTPPILDERLTEELLNKWLPPRARAWADTWNSRWQLFWDRKRCRSFAWNRHGYVGSARLALLEMWNLHAQHRGAIPEHIQGLSQHGATGSSSSSSSGTAPPAH